MPHPSAPVPCSRGEFQTSVKAAVTWETIGLFFLGGTPLILPPVLAAARWRMPAVASARIDDIASYRWRMGC